MRENRTCGSEGGEAQSLPYPYPGQRSTLNASINHYTNRPQAATNLPNNHQLPHALNTLHASRAALLS